MADDTGCPTIGSGGPSTTTATTTPAMTATTTTTTTTTTATGSVLDSGTKAQISHDPILQSQQQPSSTTATSSDVHDHSINKDAKRDDDNDDDYDDSSSNDGLHSHRQSHSPSKLPAFRFADRNSGSAALSLPSLTPQPAPSPVSPNPPPPGEPASGPDRTVEDINHDSPPAATTALRPRAQRDSAGDDLPASSLVDAVTPPPPGAHSTAPTAHQAATHSNSVDSSVPAGIVTSPPASRPSSYPDSSAGGSASHQAVRSSAAVSRPAPRRTQNSTGSIDTTSSDPSTSAETPLSRTRESSLGSESLPDKSPRNSTLRQRELILPKAVAQSSPPDDRRMSHRPPPVSYKAPANFSSTQPAASTPVRVPPIRGFRSSGSRKSLILDMDFRQRQFDFGDDIADPNYDHTLRALEGRGDVDVGQVTSPTSGRYFRQDSDDSGDVFMKIAGEEPPRRQVDEGFADETRSTVSRTMRSSHRRPLSTAVATYQPTSPPQLTRRLSDQQETIRPRRYDDQASDISRVTSFRSALAREKAASAHPGEDLGRSRAAVPSLRPSPLTPRSVVSYDPSSENPIQGRRRPSVNDSTPPISGRTNSYKSYGKSYNSSPLAKAFDFGTHNGPEAQVGIEGTDSTASNAAPSTVWDELDDLKSRIHRLELTGKLPSTSGAAVSRLSDERPPTATTTATTMSSSPKRSGGGTQATDTQSNTPSQRDAHPILLSALTKSKPFMSQGVYKALESAAFDAMALSVMMGTSGQPGPISSGASTIGSGATITDRQLRRKGESVCRSLTELCIALGEDVAQAKAPLAAPVQAAPEPQMEVPSTPTVNSMIGIATTTSQRRLSVTAADQAQPQANPKAMSKFEERRNNILNGNTVPSPRSISSTPTTPNDTTSNRRSSIIFSRPRRAATEEPEENRASTQLRSRRAGTEEPEEGRKTSLLMRHRREAVAEGDEEMTARVPSRANTEVRAARGTVRDYQSQAQAAAQEAPQTQTPSALPRKRLISSTATSRLATPASSSIAPTRRYLERSVERDNGGVSERPVENRGPQRYVSLGQNALLDRSGSLDRRRSNRDSTITLASTAATAGGYR